MNDERRRSRVLWLSAMEIPAGMPDFDLRKGELPVTPGASFDLIVQDISSCGGFSGLKETYTGLRLKSTASLLIIVDTTEEETAALEWLSVEDDVCKRNDAALQLSLRMKRCVSRRSGQDRSSNLDPLTGVANRKGMEEYVATYRATHTADSPLCVISIELDRFKEINDKHGHAAGDQILADMGRMLQQSAAGSGCVARIGGDDFVVLMPANLDQGAAFAEFLRSQVAEKSFAAGGAAAVSITCSAGVAAAAGAVSLDDLLDVAEQCIYTAKRRGRNRVVKAPDLESLAEAAGADMLITDFENRIRVTAERLTGELVLKARKVAEQYRIEADHDGLTGLFNRRYLDRFLTRELEKQSQRAVPLCVALIDLDHFGRVNKDYGFPTGDRALKSAAAAIQQAVRATDLVARYGGEEFCIVMRDTVLATAFQTMERVRQAVAAESIPTYDAHSFTITASCGVVEFSPEDKDPVALYQRAGDKVRDAKGSGRNQVR